MKEDKIIGFFEDNNIPMVQHGHQHYREGWLNICCPFCGDSGFHLGYNLASDYFSCYRCGHKNTVTVIHEILRCGIVEAKVIHRQTFRGVYASATAPVSASARAQVTLPSSGNILLETKSYSYLRNRFKWMTKEEFQSMVKCIGITYTDGDYVNPETKEPKYLNRIIIPNHLNGKIVSFQTRAYTKQRIKYITANPEEEVVHHKHFLWGSDRVPYSKVIVNEGVMDSLSIGDGAVHTHGVEFTQNQVNCLYAFSDVYICFDTDKYGILGASKLAGLLSHRTRVHIIKLSCHDVNSCGKQEISDLKGLVQ